MSEFKPDPNSTAVNAQQDVNSSVNRADVSQQEKAQMIRSLLREREGCERRGLDERVKLINLELARYGYASAPPAKRAERRPASGSGMPSEKRA